jgi:hypothetical protein
MAQTANPMLCPAEAISLSAYGSDRRTGVLLPPEHLRWLEEGEAFYASNELEH